MVEFDHGVMDRFRRLSDEVEFLKEVGDSVAELLRVLEITANDECVRPERFEVLKIDLQVRNLTTAPSARGLQAPASDARRRRDRLRPPTA